MDFCLYLRSKLSFSVTRQYLAPVHQYPVQRYIAVLIFVPPLFGIPGLMSQCVTFELARSLR
jgi:hypothetical protein